MVASSPNFRKKELRQIYTYVHQKQFPIARLWITFNKHREWTGLRDLASDRVEVVVGIHAVAMLRQFGIGDHGVGIEVDDRSDLIALFVLGDAGQKASSEVGDVFQRSGDCLVFELVDDLEAFKVDDYKRISFVFAVDDEKVFVDETVHADGTFET